MKKADIKVEGVIAENGCSRSRSVMPFFDDSELMEFEQELDVLLLGTDEENEKNKYSKFQEKAICNESIV